MSAQQRRERHAAKRYISHQKCLEGLLCDGDASFMLALDVIYMNRIALANLESDPIYDALYFCKRLADFLTPYLISLSGAPPFLMGGPTSQLYLCRARAQSGEIPPEGSIDVVRLSRRVSSAVPVPECQCDADPTRVASPLK
ncbi:hypothetical protein ROHU_032779 [Labeo rohita]|uniref:Uncharacterized protein n=1 Tax=Labeo rohita TaxID=84645 RepID=A0A498LMF1_LABRO|nr:hypothetical protein ROHU_032779 [Labeo rohita]